MSVTIDEQETVISFVRKDAVVRIYTANPAHLRKLRNEPRATEVKTYGEEAADFTVPASQFDVLTGFKRQMKAQTEEQKQAARDRLKAAREARHA